MEQTQRGFAIKRFKDRYGNNCSIQKSSAATADCIWLGIDTDREGGPIGEVVDGKYLGARMHLDQDMVAELLPLLRHFVETGELPADSAPAFNWDRAERHLLATIKNYRELIGEPGANTMVALQIVILPLKARYDAGERSAELFQEIMDLS